MATLRNLLTLEYQYICGKGIEDDEQGLPELIFDTNFNQIDPSAHAATSIEMWTHLVVADLSIILEDG